MFYHVKDLQFNARVSKPDPRFARILLEAFGGANGELTSAMQYFVQAFSCHNPFPDKYDMLMDIATEELTHLEIVGATIQMLLLQSNMANECRAKIGYENLLSFTEDPFVKETLTFLMTREITHFQQFEAALSTIQPNFPPGTLQTSPKYSNLYFNLSKGGDSRGPWNEGESTRLKEEWQYIDDPLQEVRNTNGLVDRKPEGTERTEKQVRAMDQKLAKERSSQVLSATPDKDLTWCDYQKSTSFGKKSDKK